MNLKASISDAKNACLGQRSRKGIGSNGRRGDNGVLVFLVVVGTFSTCNTGPDRQSVA